MKSKYCNYINNVLKEEKQKYHHYKNTKRTRILQKISDKDQSTVTKQTETCY